MSDPMIEVFQQFAAHEMRDAAARAKINSDGYFFPDTPLTEIIDGLSKLGRRPVREVLRDFGRFLATSLVLPHAGRQPAWRSLELLAHAGDILQVTRRGQGDSRPLLPEQQPTRTGPDELLLAFPRGRHWCGIARGMAEAIGEHYGEQVTFSEPACLSRGGAACHLFVRVLPATLD